MLQSLFGSSAAETLASGWKIVPHGCRALLHEDGGRVFLELCNHSGGIRPSATTEAENAKVVEEFRAGPEVAAHTLASKRLAEINGYVDAAETEFIAAQDAFREGSADEMEAGRIEIAFEVSKYNVKEKTEQRVLVQEQVQRTRRAVELAWQQRVGQLQAKLMGEAKAEREAAYAELIKSIGGLLSRLTLAETTFRHASGRGAFPSVDKVLRGTTPATPATGIDAAPEEPERAVTKRQPAYAAR